MKDMFVASTLFWQTSLQDMTRQIKTDGLTGLEMWAQQFFYQNYDIEEYKTLAEAYGLRTLVHSCSWDLNLASINESIRQASVGQGHRVIAAGKSHWCRRGDRSPGASDLGRHHGQELSDPAPLTGRNQ